MVEFYHYLFYKAFLWQVRKMKDEDIPVYSPVILMSFFLGMNYVTVYDTIAYFVYHDRWPSKWDYWIPLIIIFLINYGYFKSKNHWSSVIKWGDELMKSERKKKNVIFWLYIIMTISLFAIEFYITINNIFRYY